jgi:hypothetical protein
MAPSSSEALLGLRWVSTFPGISDPPNSAAECSAAAEPERPLHVRALLACDAGSDGYGQVGDGAPANRSSPTQPTRVLGGLSFALVETRHDHTCGVTKGNVACCWGSNASGQLGIGTFDGLDRCPIFPGSFTAARGLGVC